MSFSREFQVNAPWKEMRKQLWFFFIFLLFLFSFYTHKAIVIPEQVIALSLRAVRKYLVRDVGVQRFVNFGLREARRMFVCKNKKKKKRKVFASFYFTTEKRMLFSRRQKVNIRWVVWFHTWSLAFSLRFLLSLHSMKRSLFMMTTMWFIMTH